MALVAGAYRYVDGLFAAVPFGNADLVAGAPKQAIVDRLGSPTERQASDDGSHELLVYRRGKFSLELTFRGGQLDSWTEKGPFRIRRLTEGKAGCCD